MENEDVLPGRTVIALLVKALPHRFLVFLGVAVGVAAAVIATVVLTPSRYDATSIVGLAPSTSANVASDAVRLATAQLSAGASDGVRLAAVEKAAGVPAGGLPANNVRAEQVPDTGLIQLVVSDRNPQTAAVLANALASNLAASADPRQLRGEVVRAANTPTAPSSPTRGLYTAAGVFAGVGVGLVLIYVLEIVWPGVPVRHSS